MILIVKRSVGGRHASIGNVVVIHAFLINVGRIVRIVDLYRRTGPASHIDEIRFFDENVIEPNLAGVATPFAKVKITLRAALAVEGVIELGPVRVTASV